MYSIGKFAIIAGVSLKTLRHYEKIGLLIPAKKKENGFRYYSFENLLRLQQILFYKELDFPLKVISEIFNNPDFEPIKELKKQKILLNKKLENTEKLIKTIEKTINILENKMENNIMISDEELYEGFTKEQAEEYRNEAINNWGDKVKESEMRIKKLGKDGWNNLKEKGEKITRKLAELMDKYPEHPDVQDQIIEWHYYINNFYDCTPEILLSLGRMYSEDSRFTEHYEKFRKGLAIFITKAIEYYYEEKIFLKREK